MRKCSAIKSVVMHPPLVGAQLKRERGPNFKRKERCQSGNQNCLLNSLLKTQRGFEPLSFQLLTYHLAELKYRIIYSISSFLGFFCIFILYLPKILEYSPFYYNLNNLEDAILCYLSAALLGALCLTLPYIIFQMYLFLKPALLPIELSFFHLAILYFCFM